MPSCRASFRWDRSRDLTIQVNQRFALRRKLLRWRDVIAEVYFAEEVTAQAHDAAFRCLLRFTPVASQQIPYLLATRTPLSIDRQHWLLSVRAA